MTNIIGATGKVNVETMLKKIEVLTKKWNLDIVLLNADMVFGREHLISAYEHARRAFESEKNIAKTLPTEIILYASGERQISKALDKMGVKDGMENVAILFVEEPKEIQISEFLTELELNRNDDVLQPNEGNLVAFGIAEEELGAVPEGQRSRIVLEKVAFVDLLK